MSEFLSLLLIALLQLIPKVDTAEKPDAAELTAMAQRALAVVEKMRGQKLTRPLVAGVKDKAEITAFIQRRLNEEYGPAKVEAEGRLLKLQGLLPESLDYGGFITRLLAEQVAGFYDHTRQELYLASWIPLFMQEPVAAHEIFHAIQDQEWGGGKLLDSKKFTHDQVLAHAALMEGDATIVMLNYPQAKMGESADLSESKFTMNLIASSLPLQMASPDFPLLAAAPDYLKQSLIFPYQQGLLFVAALRQSGMSWAEIRRVYADPPQSSEQILHPSRYLPPRDVPSQVTVPPLAGKGFKRTWDSTVGEFHLRQLLLSRLPVGRATTDAAGWDGDFTAVEASGDQAVAYTVSTWDSEAEAARFATALREVEGARPDPKPHFELVERGTEVVMVWATEAGLARKVAETALYRAKIVRR